MSYEKRKQLYDDTMKKIEEAKKQGKTSIIIDLSDHLNEGVRIGNTIICHPAIDSLVEKLIDLGYLTSAKLVKDTTLKIGWGNSE